MNTRARERILGRFGSPSIISVDQTKREICVASFMLQADKCKAGWADRSSWPELGTWILFPVLFDLYDFYLLRTIFYVPSSFS